MRAILATILLAFGTGAGAAQPCTPVGTVLSMLQAHPGYGSHWVADETAATAAAAIFNAVPPETDAAWTRAILVDFRDGSGALLVGRDNAICGSLLVPPGRWNAVVRAIRGAGV